jgi:hypothetical protein
MCLCNLKWPVFACRTVRVKNTVVFCGSVLTNALRLVIIFTDCLVLPCDQNIIL